MTAILRKKGSGIKPGTIHPYLVIAVMMYVSITAGRRSQAAAARRGATTATPPQDRGQ